MPIGTPAGNLDIKNATLRTSNLETQNIKIGSIFVGTGNSLEETANVGNSMSNTIQFTNTHTAFTTTGNVSVGKDLTVTGNVTASTFSDGTAQLTGGTWSGSAASLTTAVDIGGVAFDGSASIVPTTFGAATFSGDVTVDTNTLHVDSTNNRLGVGTTSPDANLHVVGTARADTFNIDGNVFHLDRKSNGNGVSMTSYDDFSFYVGGTGGTPESGSRVFNINSDRRVGIRTASPSFPLSVSDASVKQWNAFDNNTSAGDYTFTKSGIYLVGFMYGDGADGNTCEYYTITAATSHGVSCGVTKHKDSGYLNAVAQDHDTVRFWSGSPSSALPAGFNSSNFHLRIYFAGYF